ncbi:MBL fold metallo-hydrolase, partial [candidate division GN15 bacterium]|nr:MBL fold metallo-hydrolase [candidate division GN15 bacterium]
MISLAFHGAAQTVTGSKYLLETGDENVLIDAGFFQGRRELRLRNWASPGFNPADLQQIVLTHAHIDHIGYLPRLVKLGFTGKVYATAPTIDLAKVSLIDSAHIQEEDAEYRNRKNLTRHRVALPLFTTEDAEQAIRLLTPAPYGQWQDLSRNLRFRYHIVGHILGAASVELEATDNDRKVSILFSGDVGRYGNPLSLNPEPPPETDYLVCESTYGDRMHPPEDPYTEFEKLINDARKRKAILLIPAFAISRTQQIIYLINDLIRHRRVKPIHIHVDSPMAVSATDIYQQYHEYHQLSHDELSEECLLEGSNVTLHRKRKSSKTLNKLKGPAVIMSSSGMMSGGRIMHHLINRLPDPETTLVVAGFMAEGTLGRRLVDGDKIVYIHKQPVDVRAKLVQIQGLSGHADYHELLHWLEGIQVPPKRVFVV